MKRARIFLGVLFFAMAGGFAAAQDSTNAPPDVAPTNAASPVVMPPPSQLPPTPAADTATPAPVQAIPSNAIPPGMGAPGAKPEDIYDIRPPFFFLRSWTWLWLVLAAVAVVALLVYLWRFIRGRSRPDAKTAYDLALEKIEKARALMNEENPAPYAIAVSEAIRTYLGQRFQAPSSRRTTEEFLRQMQNDTSTPLAEHRDLLGDFLQACDLVKFARYQPTFTELEKVQRSAFNFVTATKPAPESSALRQAVPA